jgi:hypothetical protein
MPSLCSLEEIKTRLLVKGVNADRDAMLDAYRLAVEERVLDLAGFTFASGNKTEQHENVQLGVSRLMKFRPILPLSDDPQRTVQLMARSLASSTLSEILGDIRDPVNGRIMPLASELTPVFPPVGGQAPWLRWRQMIWPTVIFTYKVDPLGSATNPVPASLNRACVEWASAIAGRYGGGVVQSYSAEGISETFSDPLRFPMPPIVTALMSKYIRGQAGLVF